MSERPELLEPDPAPGPAGGPPRSSRSRRDARGLPGHERRGLRL